MTGGPIVGPSFSRRTLAALARALEKLITNADIDNLSLEFDVVDEAAGTNKLTRLTRLVTAIEPPPRQDEVVRQLINRYVAPERRDRHGVAWAEVKALTASLRDEGFDIAGGKLQRTTPSPAALAPQVSALERTLKRSGLAVAANHYAQACDNFGRDHFEAANGQLRSYLESVFMVLAEKLAGRRPKNAPAALQLLRSKKIIDDDEQKVLSGLWVCPIPAERTKG